MRRILLKGFLTLAASLTGLPVLALGNVSVNFYSNVKVGTTSGEIPESKVYGIYPTHGWNNLSSGTKDKTSALDPVQTGHWPKLYWSAGGVGYWIAATDEVLRGYIDDNKNASSSPPRITIKVTELPYPCYDVIIYQATDSENVQFNPPKVNGLYYSYDGSMTSTTERDPRLRYGQSRMKVAEVGKNVIKLERFTGDLEIVGCQPKMISAGTVDKTEGRGSISALQIVERPRQCWGNLGLYPGAGTIASTNDVNMSATYDFSFGDQSGVSYRGIGMYGDAVIREFRLALAYTDPLAPDSIEITDGETTIKSTKVDVRSGTVYGKDESLKYTHDIATYFFDSEVSFNTSRPLKIKMNVSGGWSWRGMVAKPKNDTFSDGTWSPVFLLSGEYTVPRSIAVNFNSNQGEAQSSSGAIPAWIWNNVPGATTNEMPLVRSDNEEELSGAVLTCSGNTRAWTTATEPFLKGYIDDSAANSITVSNIPFARYDVIVYQATDAADCGFNPPLINGRYFSWDGTKASKTPNDVALKYGASQKLAPTYGQNVVYVPGGFSNTQPLTIVGAGNANGARGGIAAIQIVEAETSVYTARVSSDTLWSDIDWSPRIPATGVEANAKFVLTVTGNPEIAFDEPFELGVCGDVTIVGAPVLKVADTFYRDGCWEREVMTVGTFTADEATFPTTLREGFVGAYTKSDTGFSLRAQNKEVISVNLAGGSIASSGTFPPQASPAANLVPDTSDLYGLAPTPGSSWNNLGKMWKNVSTNVALGVAYAYDVTNVVRRETVDVTASAYTTWQADSVVNPFLRGYLGDDGNGAHIVIHGIPYTQYEVIVYGMADSANTALAPVSVNGKSYTFLDGETVEGTNTWGVGAYGTPAFGRNALKISNCVGDTLTIDGRAVTGGRGAIAAVQIVCLGSVASNVSYTATISESTHFKDIVWDDGKTFEAGQLNDVTITVDNQSAEEVEILFDDADMMLGKLTIKSSRDIRLTATKPLPSVGQLDLSQCTGKITYAWPVTSLEMRTDGKVAYVGGSGSETAPAPISFVEGGELTLAEMKAPYYVGATYNAAATDMAYTMLFTNAAVIAGGVLNSDGDTGLGIGQATVTVAGTSVVTAQNIVLSQGQNDLAASLTIKDESRVVATGTTNQDGSRNAVTFGCWNGPTTFTLQDAAAFTAASDVLVGKSRNDHTLNILGGTFTARGIKASSQALGTNLINLNGGELVLGETGISFYGGTRRTISVNVGGDAKITSSAAMPISQPVIIAAGKTLTFAAAGGDITLNGSVVNNGTNVIASGTVRLAGTYSGTGPIVVKGGATLDYGGKYPANLVIVEAGGAVVNSGAAMTADKALLLELAGDATLGGPSEIRFGSKTQFAFNGHALTVARDGVLSLLTSLQADEGKIVVGAETKGTLAVANALADIVLDGVDLEVSAKGTLDLSKGMRLTCRDFKSSGSVVGTAATLVVTGTLDASDTTRVTNLALADGATLIGTGLIVSDTLTLGDVLYVECAAVQPGKIAEVPEGTKVDGTTLVYNGARCYVLACSGTTLSVRFNSNNWISYADYGGIRKEGDVFVPTNAVGLAWIAAEAATNAWFSGTVKLGADIDLSQWNWTPIRQFTGTFDGQGHRITGLNNTNVVEDGGVSGRYVGGTTNDWGYVSYGLFASATNAAFRNVTLSDVAIANESDSVAALLGVHAGGDLSVQGVTVESGRVRGEGRAVAGVVTVGCADNAVGNLVVSNNVNGTKVVGSVANVEDGGNVAQILAGAAWGTTFGDVAIGLNTGKGSFDVRVTDGDFTEVWTRSGFSWMDLPVCNLAPAVLRTDAAGTFSRYVEANDSWAIPVDPVKRTARMSVGCFANGGANILGWWTDQITAVEEGALIVITNNGTSVELDGWSTVVVDRNVTMDLNGNSIYGVYDCDVFEIAGGKTLTISNGKISVGPGCEPFVGAGQTSMREVNVVRLSENFEERTFENVNMITPASGKVTLIVPLTCSSCLYGVETKTELSDDWQIVPESVQNGNGGDLVLEAPAEAASGFYRIGVMLDVY